MKILYLLPNILHEQAAWDFKPPPLDALIAESEKGGRAYLKRHGLGVLPVYLLNEHTKDIQDLLSLKEPRVGLISDAGMPCLADPGSLLVFSARKRNIEIVAFPGPSSILLGFMLSGFSGQSFTFHGYLQRDGSELAKQIRSFPKKTTQIFIEAPYRNDKMVQYLLKNLHDRDQLCIAWNLTGPDEGVVSQSVKEWKASPPPSLDKKPAIFLVFKEAL
jgi:16S rRNA (cytidine1402-2'-O)-methyltransferase